MSTNNNNPNGYDMIFKIVLIGDTSVGKTNILSKYLTDEFDPDSKATVGVEFGTKNFKIENNIVKVQIWDTAGQERYRSITNAYYKGAKGSLLVYDITNKKSFTELENWHKQVKESLGDNIVLGVLGNKKDLFLQEDVKEEEAEEYAKSIGAKWGLTSAKTERSSFVIYMEDLIKIYIEKAKIKDKDKQIEETEKKGNIKLNSENIEPKKKKKCC